MLIILDEYIPAAVYNLTCCLIITEDFVEAMNYIKQIKNCEKPTLIKLFKING
jgi:hypothetical protein